MLVTPVHDEIDQLADLVGTVRAQEIPPAAWLLVDDDSHDGSSEAVERIAEREPWIHALHLRRSLRDAERPERYAQVVAAGFEAAFEIAEAEGIEFAFAANLDADVRCPPHLIAELVARMRGDRAVGIASCTLAEILDDDRIVPQPPAACGGPRGGVRLWRRECLEEIAFYPVADWASVTGLRARNRGWKTVVHPDLIAEVVRPCAMRGGWWQGYRRKGQAGWQIGMHPALLAAEAVTASARDGDLRGLAMLAGYVESAVRRQRRSRDPELRQFYGEDLPRERLAKLFERIPFLRTRR